jgi:CRISPR system Cascade subunit CasE
MDALYTLPPNERASARHGLLNGVAHAWLARQGERHGFALDALRGPARAGSGLDDDDHDGPARGAVFRVAGYRVLRVDRGRRSDRLQVGVLDTEGVLTVRDPASFLAAVGAGFGRAKAFGCGLMLVRRAPA